MQFSWLKTFSFVELNGTLNWKETTLTTSAYPSGIIVGTKTTGAPLILLKAWQATINTGYTALDANSRGKKNIQHNFGNRREERSVFTEELK